VRELDQIILEDIHRLESYEKLEFKEFQKIVILGCSGMLGSYLMEALTLLFAKNKSPRKIVGISRKFSTHATKLEKNFQGTLSLHTYNKVNQILAGSKDVLVIHCASPSSYQAISKDRIAAISTNIELTLNICKQLTNIGGHICFLSSGEVYGETAQTPMTEESYSPIDHLSPRGLYPEVKKNAELILQTYSQNNEKMNSSILRVAHTFGPGLSIDDPRIFGVLVKSIVTTNTVHLNSDGSGIRTFMYSSDLLSAIHKVSQIPKFSYFNVAGTESMSVKEFCNIAELLFGTEIYINETSNDSVPRSSQVGKIDTSKIRATGWLPDTNVEQALKNTVASVRLRLEQNR
jgi:nucleoside-diphosphate-sugar epimerase